jgi:GNAT superfamily N-acetyltransferase
MMTYNPPYYPRLVESYGFEKSQDAYAYWGNAEMLPKAQARFRPLIDEIIERYEVTVRSLDRSRFLEEVEGFLSVYNRSMANTWGFVPMSVEEIRHMAKGLRHLIVPELAIGAEVDGRLIGATFCLPDYNPRIKAINGRLFPFGFIRLLWRKDTIKRVRLVSTNVLPEYQRLGFGLVLLDGLVPKALDWGLQEAEFSWILESNRLSWRSLYKGGALRIKTYRLYDFDES